MTEQAGCPICGGLGYITTLDDKADYCEGCDGNGWVELAVEVDKNDGEQKIN